MYECEIHLLLTLLLVIVKCSFLLDNWMRTTFTKAGRERVITESELSRISTGIGSDWTLLAEILSFKRPQIEQIQQNNFTIEDCCRDMLIKWKNKNGSAASVEKLVNFLLIFGVDEDCYKPVINAETRQKSGV